MTSYWNVALKPHIYIHDDVETLLSGPVKLEMMAAVIIMLYCTVLITVKALKFSNCHFISFALLRRVGVGRVRYSNAIGPCEHIMSRNEHGDIL